MECSGRAVTWCQETLQTRGRAGHLPTHTWDFPQFLYSPSGITRDFMPSLPTLHPQHTGGSQLESEVGG